MRSIVRFDSVSDSLFRNAARFLSAAAPMLEIIQQRSHADLLETVRLRHRFAPAMATPEEFRNNAEDCLKLARENGGNLRENGVD